MATLATDESGWRSSSRSCCWPASRPCAAAASPAGPPRLHSRALRLTSRPLNAYDAANRPTSGANPTAAYSSDADGALTTRPGARYEWDHLGRLTRVRPATGTGTLATYTYDPLDRLRMADYGGSTRIRFRYVGLTTAVAQTIDDQPGTVIRHFGTGWGGERLLDWTGAGANLRVYGSNAHHDVTWTASSTGAVSATLRYDPWGTLTHWTGSSLPDHRFQGSWFDTTTDLAWVVSRWYAPTLGRFLTEDSLLGEPADPPSRHLYAYAQGEPVGRWDPDGRFWLLWASGDTPSNIAGAYLGGSSRRRALWNTNRGRPLSAGRCIWVPRDVWYPSSPGRNECIPNNRYISGNIKPNYADKTVFEEVPLNTRSAATKIFGDSRTWYLLSASWMKSLTWSRTSRSPDPAWYEAWAYSHNQQLGDNLAIAFRANTNVHGAYFSPARMHLWWGANAQPPAGNRASTFGRNVFLDGNTPLDFIRCCGLPLLSHEYIHVLQWQGRGADFALEYAARWGFGTGPSNKLEAPGYLWQGWMSYFYRYGEKPPWEVFKPL